MTRRKKLFPCGHKGHGKVCHRCTQAADNQNPTPTGTGQVAEASNQKREWKASFDRDLIDLRGLPDYVVVKARNIITGLCSHEKHYRDYGGKRLRHNRLIISIPVTRNYRMLCEDSGNFLVPQKVLSHEDYNTCKPR
ncbi:MAG: hypothetical protein ACFBSC_02720 [Microcoleaceae cyanobacterium]